MSENEFQIFVEQLGEIVGYCADCGTWFMRRDSKVQTCFQCAAIPPLTVSENKDILRLNLSDALFLIACGVNPWDTFDSTEWVRAQAEIRFTDSDKEFLTGLKVGYK